MHLSDRAPCMNVERTRGGWPWMDGSLELPRKMYFPYLLLNRRVRASERAIDTLDQKRNGVGVGGVWGRKERRKEGRGYVRQSACQGSGRPSGAGGRQEGTRCHRQNWPRSRSRNWSKQKILLAFPPIRVVSKLPTGKMHARKDGKTVTVNIYRSRRRNKIGLGRNGTRKMGRG